MDDYIPSFQGIELKWVFEARSKSDKIQSSFGFNVRVGHDFY